LFTVARKTSYEPLEDCRGSWTECSPETISNFSATAYFFGLELFKELGVPVGLIHSSWGGTPAEAWTSNEFIRRIPYFQTSPGECDPPVIRQKKLDAHEIIQNEWLESLGFIPDDENPPAWVLPDFEDKWWEEIKVPAKWENTRLGKYLGMAEFRLKFKVPRKWKSKELIIELGPVDEIDITWVNGVNIGSHPNPWSWNTPRIYTIPEGVVKKGKNTLAIQVGNTSGAGGIFGDPDQLRIYPKDDRESFRLIKGEWVARKSLSYGEIVPMPYCHNCGESGTPTTLYNGMIKPLIPFRIKGAIWYQGESNRMDGLLYNKIFPNMINCWRNDWKQGDFPFYYVQIAPYTYSDEFSTGQLKEAQQNAMMLSNTGMVTTGDVGDMITIHPPDKESVGKRLAYWALAKEYGKDVAFSGPIYSEYRIEGDKIRIIFDYAGYELVKKGDSLTHFQIAGRNREFVPAQAVIDGNTVLVSSPDISDPAAVRFGWGSTDETNLFNRAGLPAGPFRTDRWNEIK
jgi:sialate O-acetylesterase